MKKLILHIGTHKTATTAIQNTLDAEGSQLAEQSVLYGSTNRPPFEHLKKHTSLFSALIRSQEEFDREKNTILQELDQSGMETLILSEEALSEPRYEAYERMRSFADIFDITVICYLRRPDFFLESLWNQYVKEGVRKENILQFSKDEFNFQRLQYCRVLDFWSEFATVRPVNFDVAKSEGVVKAFAKLAGIELEGEAAEANVSPSMNCATVLSALNRQGKPFNKRKVLAAFRGDIQKTALGSTRRTELLAALATDMKGLENRYGVAFDMEMPEERAVPLLRPSPKSLALAFSRLCPPS